MSYNESNLPFDIQSPKVQSAMKSLGLIESDIEYIPLNIFQRKYDPDIAKLKFEKMLKLRSQRIKEISDYLNSPQQTESIQYKPSHELSMRKYQNSVQQQRVSQLKELEKKSLRTIALNQLRQIYFLEKAEQQVQKVDQLSIKSFQKDDKSESTLTYLKTDRQRSQTPPRCSRVHFTYNEKVFEEKKAKYHESAQKLEQKRQAGVDRLNQLYQETLKKNNDKILKVNTLVQTIPSKCEQRNQLYSQRNEKLLQKSMKYVEERDKIFNEKIHKIEEYSNSKNDKFINQLEVSKQEKN